MAAKALPTHLRAPATETSNAGSFGKHHGKSQSHMVSLVDFMTLGWSCDCECWPVVS
ncbi:hypothetical protein BDV33DRAFT_178374 [Aspergillus novoparasiticus]|uniref:Uncharacterized protein n=1 Tax=Aspergillus novoparasiticus TaxID=986946 RepID=A0A5N6EGS0_9EURO|nr:hypothetical protein BDV33DRAFT_178374 [Aspergillus novoparasiticus]